MVLCFTPCTAIKAKKECYPEQGCPLGAQDSWAPKGAELKGFSPHVWSAPLSHQGEPEATHGSVLAGDSIVNHERMKT